MERGCRVPRWPPIGWPYVTYVFAFCAKEERAVRGSLMLVGETLLLVLLLTSFFRAVFFSPGHVPRGWVPADATHNEDGLLDGRQSPDGPVHRICRKCSARKPDRAHHCSICDRCVLKMDHHCPWTNNCVGFANYKFFCLFLFYIPINGFFVAVTVMTDPGSWGTIFENMNLLMAVVSGCVFALGLGSFFIMHFQMVLSNRTTIESHGRNNQWDVGAWNNFVSVFGPHWWLWILPVNSTPGDGIHFPTRPIAWVPDEESET